MIRYPEFLQKGWQIGSGPTEAMCKTNTARLKRCGMRWDADNADALIALTGLEQVTNGSSTGKPIDGVDELVWSAVLDFENSPHPLVDRRNEIARWAIFATARVTIDPRITTRAQELETAGLRPLDAAHLACAEAAVCDRFLTCDDQLTRKARAVKMALVVQNPTEYVAEQTHA
jgi:predicted nucleic acid-binding protein